MNDQKLVSLAIEYASRGDDYTHVYGNYLNSHYLALIPESAVRVWGPLKAHVVAACHLRTLKSIPSIFPTMVQELATLSRELKPEDYINLPYYVPLRAIDLAIYETTFAPFVKRMPYDARMKIQNFLRVLNYNK